MFLTATLLVAVQFILLTLIKHYHCFHSQQCVQTTCVYTLYKMWLRFSTGSGQDREAQGLSVYQVAVGEVINQSFWRVAPMAMASN